MLLQVIIPQTIFAQEDKSLPRGKYVKIGTINAKSYDAKIMNQLNRIAAKNRESRSVVPGIMLFSSGPYFGKNNEPRDKDKPKYYGNISVDFKLSGLDGNPFQWEEIFGVDEQNKPKPAQIIFTQSDEETGDETGVEYLLKVTQTGKYTWQDANGNPTNLPLFSEKFKPYTYEARVDEDVAENIKLLTARMTGTEGSSPTFSPENSEGKIIANITLDLGLQQVASTKFKSTWHTGVAEADRPQIKGSMQGIDDGTYDGPVAFEFPKNNKDVKIIRDWEDSLEEGLIIADSLYNTPTVKIDENNQNGLTFDTAKKTVTSGGHKFKYDFKYDVINGGKLTMTEVLPVTFDANGGKFASVTKPNAKQEIVKEVDYDGTLTNKAETPTKDRETFKGWSTKQNGTIPVTDDEYKNIKKAKTFYAIWDNNDIVAKELTVHESFKDGDYVNDFIPNLAKLKEQVTIKGANGTPQALKADDEFAIVDGTKEYKADGDDLKNYLYEKLKEKDNPNGEPTRVETVKAKITHKNGTTQTVDIPIKVIKNIYEAKTLTEMPYYVPADYVKVTLDPTTKAKNPQKTYYYVNKAAKVVIPGKNPTGVKEAFTRWTTGTGAGLVEYKLKDRHQFKDATTITAQYETGKASVEYVDENGNKIADTYKKSGIEYPTEMSGKLGDDVAKPADSTAPEFEGYVFSSVNITTTGKYADPAAAKITYKYYKKITTEDKSQDTANYFKVVFDANGGKLGTADTKDVYVYYQASNPSIANVKFEDVKKEAGKPTKKDENFVDWQDKKTSGTKVADDKAIVQQASTTETFYAHYEKAGAKIVYVDLKNKEIADKFKVGTDYPSEKFDELNKPIPADVFTDTTAPKFIGYKFQRFELNPENSKYTLDKSATIKIYYEKLPDVIPSKGNDKPDGYLEVKFVPTDKAKDTSEKIFYVNPKNDVTIPLADPVAKATYTFKEWKMGADAKGAVYNPATPQKFTEATTVITATYGETENIIPYDPVTDPTTRPDGYKRVTFVAEKGLNLENVKHYYVKKNAGITLKTIKDDTNYGYPTYKEETGYEFVKWDHEDTTEITDTDIVVTAKAKELESFIPADGHTKPDGYVTVTFEAEATGSLDGVLKYYVNPTKYVAFNPPTAIGNTGYEFASWSQNSAQDTNYKKDTTITAKFAQIGAVSLVKKPGYVEVDFVIKGKGGSILNGQNATYYVDPNRKVTLNAPVTSANVGYEFASWSQDPAAEKEYKVPTTIEGTFNKLADIIPGDKTKPEGYVTLTFEKGNGGKTITGQTVYYVNPKANPAKTLGEITKPNVTSDTGYTFEKWDTEDSFPIKADKTVTAKYKELDPVIVPGPGVTKPEGYATVTFDTTDKGLIAGTNNTEKIVYVNPNKPVVLKGHEPNIVPTTNNVFARWDVNLTKETFFKNRDRITAQYYDKTIISVIEVKDFVKVVFENGDHGSLSGTTIYWVKPGLDVTVPAPTVNSNTGYEFNNWNNSLTVNLPSNSKTYTIKAEYKTLEDIIEGDKIRPNGYVKVEFVSDGNGDIIGTTSYYVNPTKPIDLTSKAEAIFKNPNLGYTEIGGNWLNDNNKNLNDTFSADARFKYNFKELKDVDTTNHPGYVKVEFIAGENGQIVGGNKTYYVNPNKNITVGSTDLPIPGTSANKNYEFDKWFTEIDQTNPVTSDRTYIAQFKLSKVTLTYEANDATSGTVPKELSYDIGTEITLAGRNDLKKDNYSLTGWKIGDKTYKPGEKFTINENTTATAVWETDYHNVDFNTDGGTYIEPKKIKHNETIGAVTNPEKVNYTFTGWKVGENDFDLATSKVTKDITLVAQYVPNVVEQTNPNTKPSVPNNFVKVIVKTSENGVEKATDDTKFERTFWVNPEKEVTIQVNNPTGKVVNKNNGEVDYTWQFIKWDEQLTQKFTKETTITAKYQKAYGLPEVKPIPEAYGEFIYKDLNQPISQEEYENAVTLPKGYSFPTSKLEIVKGPDISRSGYYRVEAWVTYPDGLSCKVIIGVYIGKEIPQPQPQPPIWSGGGVRYETIYKEKIVEVPANTELFKEVKYMQGFKGYFRPKDGLRRCEAAQILANALREDGYRYDLSYRINYRDIGKAWYTDAIKITSQANVFTGYPDGTFRPYEKITRAEWIATLRRFQNIDKVNGNHMNLRNDHWALEEIEGAYNEGWLKIYRDGLAKFKADEFIPRQEVAAVTNRAFNRVCDRIYISRNDKSLINYRDINPSMWAYQDILCASNTFIHDKKLYRAHGIKDDNVTFNVNTEGLKLLQSKFQRILR